MSLKERKVTGNNNIKTGSSAVLWIAVTALIAAAVLISPVSADQWVGGKQPETIQAGVVSGDVWFDSMYGFIGGTPGQGSSAEKTFTIPDYTEIKWARLYVAVYCGNMENNYPVQATVAFNGGQGMRNLGVETLNQPYVFEIDGGHTPVAINGHCNRVTSDYLMWYDVTDRIHSNSVTASVHTDAVPGYTLFDGRIKLITLVVAYEDGDNDEVYYWVNQGHDVHSYYVEDNGLSYTGRTTFDTRDLPPEFGIDSAKLGVVHLASENGIYTFNGESIDTLSSQGSYSGYQVWDVTDSVYAETNSEMTYTRNMETQVEGWQAPGAFYKIPLAILTVKHVGEPAGNIKIESNPKEAAIFIDDEEQEAITDSLISALPVGTHSVYVHKDSYRDPDPVDVEVLKGETSTVSFALEPITGSIEVSSEPEGAAIILDGKDTGLKTGADFEDILIGKHTVAVSLDGYYEQSKEVIVEEGDTTSVEFLLVPDDDDLEDESVYGYSGKELGIYKKGSVNGGLLILNSSRYTGLITKGGHEDYTIPVSLPENATVILARLYLYSTWGHDTVKKEGKKPQIEATLDGTRLYLEKAHRDRKGEGIYNYILETSCYDVSKIVDDSGDYRLSVSNIGGANDVFAQYGASMIIVYEEPGSPQTLYWIAEGCDSLLASDEFETDTESCTTTVDFSGSLDSASAATLYFVSTAASGISGDENRLAFNDYEAFNLLNGGSSDISTAIVDAKPFLKKSGNELSVQSYVSGNKGDYMENRLAILTVEQSEDAGTGTLLPDNSDGDDTSGTNGSGEWISGSKSYPLLLSGERTGAESIDFGNGTLELYINEGTAITLPSGMAVDSITIESPEAPEGVLRLFDITPEDAESDIPVLLSAALPEASGCGGLTFVYYPTESWEGQVVDSTCNNENDILSCRISRFGRYGIAPLSGFESDSGGSGLVFPLNVISGLAVSFMDMIGFGDGDGIKTGTVSSLSSSAGNSSQPPSSGPEVIEIDPTFTDFDVQICSNPSSAKIFIDGEYTGKTTPSVFTLRGGDHDLELELEDFNPYTGEFLVSDNTTVYADLQTTSKIVRERKSDGYAEVSDIEGIGGVYVTSSPGGATVYINGYNTGMMTPCVFYGLKEGMNTIKVKKAKFEYSTNSKKIWVDSGCVMPVNFGVSTVLNIKADIDSIEYDGYYFTINGHLPEYKLPKVVAVDSANSFITFREDGKYISYNIHAYYDGELNDIRPREYRFGKVFVESVPEGAEIYVDGYDTGYCTPYAIAGLSDGEHYIEVSKPGYIRDGKSILLTPDESEYDAKLKIILESYAYGSLEVTSTPPGAKIYLYKKDTGKTTPFTFRYMDIGGIDVKVVGSDQTVTREDVIINPFETTVCHADLG